MTLQQKELVSKQAVLSDFLQSDMEKVYLIVGQEEVGMYSFIDQSISNAARNKENMVFHHEIWEGENSRHFLYRWLRGTVSGQSFVGYGQWSEIVNSEPQLIGKLRMLVEQDVRPLEIRFIEAIRFISQQLTGEQKLIISIVPRTGMHDKILLDFFRAMLRVIPIRVKLMVGQVEQDVLAKQPDFSPSNRVVLEGVFGEEALNIKNRYNQYWNSEDIRGQLLRILSHLVHPVDLLLLSELTGEPEESLEKILNASELDGLLEKDPENRIRLAFPRTASGAQMVSEDFSSIDKKVVEFYKQRLLNETNPYPHALFHSLSLFRTKEPEFFASQTLSTHQTKLGIGGADICEYELDRALQLVGDSRDSIQTDLLLTLGEIRESRGRNIEAIEVLAPAIEILEKADNHSELQRALELKGRAAFSLREVDSAKAALQKSLQLAREMDKPELVADILSQLAYVHFSSQQLQDAENLYQQALNAYQDLSGVNEEVGRKGEARQWANLGHTLYAKGDFNQSEAYHRKALDIYKSMDDKKAEGSQWGYLGHTFFAAKEYEKAHEAYEKAAELEEMIGEHHKAAQRHANVGHSMYAQRKIEIAAGSFQKALEKYRELGNPEGEAAQLSNLGIVKGDQGEFEKALGYFDHSAQIYKELGDTLSEAAQIVKQGHVRRAQKQYDTAVNLYQDALKQYRSLKYQIGEGNTEMDMGQLYAEKQDWEEAIKCYNRAKEIFAKVGHKEKETLSLLLIGQAEQARGEVNPALDAYKKAMDLYKKAENMLGVANVASQMGLLQYEQKNFGEAEKLYQEAIEIFREKEDKEGESNLLSNLGTLYFNSNQLDKASESFESALSMLRDMGHPLGIASVLQNLSYVYEKEEKYADSYDCLKEAKEIFESIQMTGEVEAIGERLVSLDEKAGKSLEKIRAELYPGLGKSDQKKGKKKPNKVGRNDPCPCGSGKKYKKCCGI